MPQYLRPISTITATEIGGGTHLDVDEITANDSDFVWSNNNTTAVFEVLLSAGVNPNIDTDHTIRFRHSRADNGVPNNTSGSTSTISYEIYQGATQISQGGTFNMGAWGTTSIGSFSGDIANITDYSDLRIRFTIEGGGGSPSNRRGGAISWVEFEVPDAPTSNVSVDLDSQSFTESLNDITVTIPVSENVTIDSLSYSEVINNIDATGQINTSTELDSLAFVEALNDLTISTTESVSIVLDSLSFSSVLEDITVFTVEDSVVNLDSIALAITQEDITVSTTTTSDTLLDSIIFNINLEDILVSLGVSLTHELDSLSFNESLNDLGVSTSQSVETDLDSLSIIVSLNDISVSLDNAVSVDLDSILFSELLNDISVNANSNVDLDSLGVSLNLFDVSAGAITEIALDSVNYNLTNENIIVSAVANETISLDSLNYSLGLSNIVALASSLTPTYTYISYGANYKNFYKVAFKDKTIKREQLRARRPTKKRLTKTYKEITGQSY